jgi:hypothetical protein
MRGWALVLALVAAACVGDTSGPFDPVTGGEVAPERFADEVAEATAGLGELRLRIEASGGFSLEGEGVVDIGDDTATVRFVLTQNGREKTELDLDDPGEGSRVVDGSGGGPLALPNATSVDEATDLRTAIRASLEVAGLRTSDVEGSPDATTCYAAVSNDGYRQRLEACVDDGLVLRFMRTVIESSSGGLIGTMTMRFE